MASPQSSKNPPNSPPQNNVSFAFGVGSPSEKGMDQGFARKSSGLSSTGRNEGKSTRESQHEDIERLIELYSMEKKSVKDLTSITLSKHRDQKFLKEDIEEDEALEKFKASLIHKYPDGDIDKKKLDEFHTSRKVE